MNLLLPLLIGIACIVEIACLGCLIVPRIVKLKRHRYWCCCYGSILHGVWWFRLFGSGLLLRAPWDSPLFSERYGYQKPKMKFKGWRLFTIHPHD